MNGKYVFKKGTHGLFPDYYRGIRPERLVKTSNTVTWYSC